EAADAERAIRNMAKGGYDLIFTTSFAYMNPTLKVAKQFPNVKFEHATVYKQDKNMGTYLARTNERRYLSGYIAAKMTK
ncbi:BMP family ABC transporter substrate-binding protein, partial [Pseudomonas syringae pv. tagetis]|uniref:BMP family ABC transporter substrate-binding protein n=1 Tax=Pseudomonas syringae group genomosp. 7 TaxID=251699 RepID=UPI00376FB6D0